MLEKLLSSFRKNQDKINAWLTDKRNLYGLHPLYASVDVRNGGYKIAPVDTNLFPAGWNNLCPSYAKRAGELFKEYFQTNFPDISCLVIIPENHTRNLFYFSNVCRLQRILQETGLTVLVGSINPDIKEQTTFETSEPGEQLTLFPVKRVGDHLEVDGKRVCKFVVNNDFSDGVPELLQGLEKSMLLPPPMIGWHRRKKSEHFAAYDELIEEFANLLEIPSWHFNCRFDFVENVDVNNESDRERIAVAVDELIAKVKADYQQFGIDSEPKIFVKSDAGTYGMAVMSVASGDDIRTMNRKERNKMSVGKGNTDVTNLIIQEGVPTTDRIKEFIAEPVVYLVGNKVAGGFYRVNEKRGDNDNLNSDGMRFTKLCFNEKLGYANTYAPDLDLEAMSELYNMVATIASLAAGAEIKNVLSE